MWVKRAIVFPSDLVILSYPEEKLKWHQWVYLLVWGNELLAFIDPFLSYADCFNSPPNSPHWSKFLLVQIQYIKFKTILNPQPDVLWASGKRWVHDLEWERLSSSSCPVTYELCDFRAKLNLTCLNCFIRK